MSLLPMLFSNWWENLNYPHRIYDQHFGSPYNPEDLSSSYTPYDANSEILMHRPYRHMPYRHYPYERKMMRKTSGTSTIEADKDKFLVKLDVQQFAPDEITVKVVGKKVMVEGKHDEQQDEHGWVSRQFLRKYMIPEQCDADQLRSTLSSDGVLTITIPKKTSELDEKERIIKIQSTGQPAMTDDMRMLESELEQSFHFKTPLLQREQDEQIKN